MATDRVLAYLGDLQDAATGGPVTSSTELVALHQPSTQDENGRLLRCLTNIARPTKRCFLVHGHETLPPKQVFGPAYQIQVTFNRLLTAPAIRLECWWPALSAPGVPDQLWVALEFGFTTVDSDGVGGVQGFAIHKNVERHGRTKDEMIFTSMGASSEGFQVVEGCSHALGESGRAVLRHLWTFTLPSPKQVRLRFPESVEAKNAALGCLLPFICGTERLASLSLPHWSTLLPLQSQRDITELVLAEAPYPMVPLECRDTYASVTQACVELYESARISHKEHELALKEWASVPHRGFLYAVGNIAVMAVQFEDFHQLGGSRFDLPDRLHTKITWTDASSSQCHTIEASRSCAPIGLPCSHDALFVLSKATDDILANCLDPTEEANSQNVIQRVTFAPRMTKFTLESQLSTATGLQYAGKWHQIILNQNHTMPLIDLAIQRIFQQDSPLFEAEVEMAFQTMLRWQAWNEEQLRALHSIRAAVGGIILITGPAGTGKTLVIQALCVFLYRVGLHVLVLAPANSNCTDFMRKLITYFPDVDATRVFPSSADFSPKRNADLHAESNVSHEEQGKADRADAGCSDLFEFELLRAEQKAAREKYATDRGLPSQVLKAAREGKYKLVEPIDGEKQDAWKTLQAFIEASDAETFDWRDDAAVEKFQHCYETCKAHYMAMSRLIVTTTGNVRCSDIVDNWARDRHVTCNGIVIILDEACKDREIDSLSALLWPDYRDKITGMIMLGDERQLEPTNTSARGQITFNPFIERLSMPFLTRLKRQSFPCTELVVQHRMSHHLAQWPSKNFYPHGLKNGPGTHTLLRRKQRGLYECLRSILRELDAEIPSHLGDVQQDREIRARYVDISGHRDNSSRSAFVPEHPQTFFNKIYWPLRAYYREKMSENVMVICAYKGAIKCWFQAVAFLQRRYNIPPAQMPKIVTIDSSQGCEAAVTFIDCSIQRYDPTRRRGDIGFVDDDRRMNVAMTRAREVRWVLGGSCNAGSSKVKNGRGTPAYVRYRLEVDEISHAGNERLPQGDTSWVERLQKKEVTLDVRFSDEAEVAATS